MSVVPRVVTTAVGSVSSVSSFSFASYSVSMSAFGVLGYRCVLKSASLETFKTTFLILSYVLAEVIFVNIFLLYSCFWTILCKFFVREAASEIRITVIMWSWNYIKQPYSVTLKNNLRINRKLCSCTERLYKIIKLIAGKSFQISGSWLCYWNWNFFSIRNVFVQYKFDPDTKVKTQAIRYSTLQNLFCKI